MKILKPKKLLNFAYRYNLGQFVLLFFVYPHMVTLCVALIFDKSTVNKKNAGQVDNLLCSLTYLPPIRTY